jgi:hypothetical protein
MRSMRRAWYQFTENLPGMLGCLEHLFFLAWLLTAFVGGGYLGIYLVKVLVPKIGIPSFIGVLSATTLFLAILFLIDLDKLSSMYRKWSRDGWFVFVQLAVLGFAFAVANMWIALFKRDVIPLPFILLGIVLLLVFGWLMDRKRRARNYKKFADIDALLKKKD